MADARTLEQKVRAASEKVGFFRKAIGTVAPVFAKYDVRGEAEQLMRDREIQGLLNSPYAKANGLNYDGVIRYLWQSREKYSGLWNSAKFADSADKVTSMAGATLEMLAAILGAVLTVPTGGTSNTAAFFANGSEEVLEMGCKAPFFFYAARNPASRQRIKGLLMREAATLAVPVFGDLYDAFTNIYVRTALDVIREDAKARLLEDYSQPRIEIRSG